MNEKLSTKENREQTELTGRAASLANLKRDAGPGRPLGSQNIQTLFRKAMIKLGQEEGITADEFEQRILRKGLKNAEKGDYRFYQDFLDRSHGKAINRNENMNLNKNMDKLPEEDKARLDGLIKWLWRYQTMLCVNVWHVVH